MADASQVPAFDSINPFIKHLLGPRNVPVETSMKVKTERRAAIKAKGRTRRRIDTLQSAYDLGARFEYDVKVALEALGYEIVRDELECGSQIDLVAKFASPLVEQVTIIECRNTGAKQGVESVRDFSATLAAFRKKIPLATAMIITRIGYTKEAKAFAASIDMMLYTLSEIQSKSFDPTLVINGSIDEFEQSNISSSYIDLSCQVTEQGHGTVYKPVEKFLDTFFNTSSKPGVAVLGNFGSGKTSLCSHYAYLTAKRWGNSEFQPTIPILIQLRDLDNLLQLERDIYEIVSCKFSSEITRAGFRRWLSQGKTLLILDGFDEMAAGMDRMTVQSNLSSLRKFANTISAQYILTCRTHFFKTYVEEKVLGDVLRLYVCDWGKDELASFVERAAPDDAGKVLTTINDTYNLNELARTPIFLSMIVETSGRLQGKVNPAKLYKHYTDQWISEQDSRSSTSSEDKRLFMEELPMNMFSSDRDSVGYDELPAIVKSVFGMDTYEKLSLFELDMRTCTFLVRDREGSYRFSHKSYSEYFVAVGLARLIKSKIDCEFDAKLITHEIASFLANYFENEAAVLIRVMLAGQTEVARANAALALGNLGSSEQVEEAMLLALKTEPSELVVQHVSAGLINIGTERAIGAVISMIAGNEILRVSCVHMLQKHLPRPQIVELFIGYLGSDTNLAILNSVISSAVDHGDEFQAAIARFVEDRTWAKDDPVAEQAMRFSSTVTDSHHARCYRRLLQDTVFSDDLTPHQRHHLNLLRLNFRPLVEESMRSEKAKLELDSIGGTTGLKRKRCEGAVRRKFEFLIDEEHLGPALDRHFPDTTITIAPRRKRS